MDNYDAGDQSQVGKKKSKARLEEEEQDEQLRSVLATYEGRAFLWRLMGMCGIYDSSFVGDANYTFFNEGKRKIGLDLIIEVDKVDKRAIIVMRDEAIERELRK